MKPKLTPQQAAEARTLYTSTNLTQKQIGKRFGVGSHVIYYAIQKQAKNDNSIPYRKNHPRPLAEEPGNTHSPS